MEINFELLTSLAHHDYGLTLKISPEGRWTAVNGIREGFAETPNGALEALKEAVDTREAHNTLSEITNTLSSQKLKELISAAKEISPEALNVQAD